MAFDKAILIKLRLSYIVVILWPKSHLFRIFVKGSKYLFFSENYLTSPQQHIRFKIVSEGARGGFIFRSVDLFPARLQGVLSRSHDHLNLIVLIHGGGRCSVRSAVVYGSGHTTGNGVVTD